jgi:hypothetical protein
VIAGIEHLILARYFAFADTAHDKLARCCSIGEIFGDDHWNNSTNTRS